MVDPQVETSVYNRIVEHVFSGKLLPGTKVREGQLAIQLGVSRVPVRESLRHMVGQGLLTSGIDGSGVRMRQYTPDELRQLFELREVLEAGIARAAARAATDADLARLELICREAESCIQGGADRERWTRLDQAFHEAMADASHNERMASSLKTLLTECHYLFYILPAKVRGQDSAVYDAETRDRRRTILETEHIALMNLVKAGDGQGAGALAGEAMRASGQRLVEALISRQLRK